MAAVVSLDCGMLRLISLLVAILCISQMTAAAQAVFGSIVGTVMDPAGAVVLLWRSVVEWPRFTKQPTSTIAARVPWNPRLTGNKAEIGFLSFLAASKAHQ
jgi:hypothetical protein